MNTLNASLRWPAILSLVLCLGYGLSGCASSYYSNVGQSAAEDQRIPADTGARAQQWQTNDMTITYDVRAAENSFTVDGTVSLKSYIMHSFPAAERFRLFINYLDENGVALATEDISPLIGYRRDIPETMKLRMAQPAPPQATAFAFSYVGTFTGGNNTDENSGDWEVYFNPFSEGR